MKQIRKQNLKNLQPTKEKIYQDTAHVTWLFLVCRFKLQWRNLFNDGRFSDAVTGKTKSPE